MILTGKEIKEKTGKHLSLDDYAEYRFNQSGNHSSANSVLTAEELKQSEESSRINELKSLIAEKQLYGEGYTKEQEELRSIKNGTHDEYLAKVKQGAVDAFTLELLESGVL